MTCQDCEKCLVLEGYHEIHISVNPQEKSKFWEICIKNGIKPLAVSFNDNTMEHVMTAQFFKGSYLGAFNELKRIEKLLSGVSIERSKIECLATGNAFHEEYFEKHLRYDTLDFTLVKGHKVSYNLKNKKPLLTIKSAKAANKREFDRQVEEIKERLAYHGYFPSKELLELVWYDTNPSYDDEWEEIR